MDAKALTAWGLLDPAASNAPIGSRSWVSRKEHPASADCNRGVVKQLSQHEAVGGAASAFTNASSSVIICRICLDELMNPACAPCGHVGCMEVSGFNFSRWRLKLI